jgi:hypothetical protein
MQVKVLLVPLVEKRRVTLIILLFCFVHLVFTVSIVSASSGNWSEVTRFTGSGTTDYFTCEHAEWRILWEYVGSEYALLTVYTYPQGEDGSFIDSIIKGANAEVMLSVVNWTTVSNTDDPPGMSDSIHYEAEVEGYILNPNDFPVYNVTISLTFDVDVSYMIYTAPESFQRTINVGTMSANETRPISEIFLFGITWRSMKLTDFSYDVKCHVKTGDLETSGVSYIRDQKGTFYMDIDATNIENFTIIVEQDLDSIPEFPSWIILPLFLIATLSVIIIKNRLFN